jgi:hypothetical protein
VFALRRFECDRKLLDRSCCTEELFSIAVAMRLSKQLLVDPDDVVTYQDGSACGSVGEHMSNDERLWRIRHQFRTHAGNAEVVVPPGNLGIGSLARALLPRLPAVVVVDLRRRRCRKQEHRSESERVHDTVSCTMDHGENSSRRGGRAKSLSRRQGASPPNGDHLTGSAELGEGHLGTLGVAAQVE